MFDYVLLGIILLIVTGCASVSILAWVFLSGL
jgi:hypothetical protein